jgi:hypothetical protein
VAAFRVVPYFARASLDIPSFDDLIDISRARLNQMEQSESEDPDGDDLDVAMEDDDDGDD